MWGKEKKSVEQEVADTVKKVMTEEKQVTEQTPEQEVKPKQATKKVSIGAMLKQHQGLIICIVALLACMLVGNIFSSSSDTRVAELENILVQYQNEIERMTKSLEDVRTIVTDQEHGLVSSRVNEDIQFMEEWIAPAFTWTGADDPETGYNFKRSIFVERLGENHPFVVNYMPPYEGHMVEGANGQVTMGSELNGYIDRMPTYVTGIDEETGVYSYVMFLYQVAVNIHGEENISRTPVILTFDIGINDSGNRYVSNLVAVNGV